MAKVNWELQGCCDHDQVVFIVAIGVSTVVILALWRTFLLTPFKLITVFLHETSHALVCKLTCGDMLDLSVVDELGNRKVALGSHTLHVGDLKHTLRISEGEKRLMRLLIYEVGIGSIRELVKGDVIRSSPLRKNWVHGELWNRSLLLDLIYLDGRFAIVILEKYRKCN